MWGCQHVTAETPLFAVYESQRPPRLQACTMADASRLPRRLVMFYMVCLHACLPSPSGSFLQSSSIGGGAFSSPRLLGPPRACRPPTPRRTAVVGPMRSELEESQPAAVQEERTGTRRLEDLEVGASFTAVWPFRIVIDVALPLSTLLSCLVVERYGRTVSDCWMPHAPG